MLEENGVEVVHVSGGTGVVNSGLSDAAPGAAGSAQIRHACDECSYTSAFKGNVVSVNWMVFAWDYDAIPFVLNCHHQIRHTKLVHGGPQGDVVGALHAMGGAIGEGGESLLMNCDGNVAPTTTNAYR